MVDNAFSAGMGEPIRMTRQAMPPAGKANDSHASTSGREHAIDAVFHNKTLIGRYAEPI
ncbi:MAG: hypothetical protein ACI8Z1_002216, partial [Candidatus Azotimanducaceae bacterium]